MSTELTLEDAMTKFGMKWYQVIHGNTLEGRIKSKAERIIRGESKVMDVITADEIKIEKMCRIIDILREEIRRLKQ